jgi:hypothetical protein
VLLAFLARWGGRSGKGAIQFPCYSRGQDAVHIAECAERRCRVSTACVSESVLAGRRPGWPHRHGRRIRSRRRDTATAVLRSASPSSAASTQKHFSQGGSSAYSHPRRSRSGHARHARAQFVLAVAGAPRGAATCGRSRPGRTTCGRAVPTFSWSGPGPGPGPEPGAESGRGLRRHVPLPGGGRGVARAPQQGWRVLAGIGPARPELTGRQPLRRLGLRALHVHGGLHSAARLALHRCLR